MNSFILWHSLHCGSLELFLALFWKILQPWLTSEPGVESVSFRPQQAACLQCSATGFKHFVKSGDIMMLLENYASFHSHEAWNYLAPTGKFCAKQAALLKTQFKSKWLGHYLQQRYLLSCSQTPGRAARCSGAAYVQIRMATSARETSQGAKAKSPI